MSSRVCGVDAMGILDRIRDVEEEMARTQKNKATEHHLGMLKAKLAKLRSQLLEGPKSAGKGEGFDTKKRGEARVALVGFPSVGKSTLLNKITASESATGAYEFTTLTAVAGVLEHNGAKIQILDLPGIIEGASEGKGRGRQVISAARTSDLILLMLDAGKGETHKRLLEAELEAVGIKLNQKPPDITVTANRGAGVRVNSTVPLTHVSEKLVREIMHLHKMHNFDILFRCDATVDEFVDVIEGNRQYLRCINVYNKIDQITIEEVDHLARQEHSVVLSCEWDLNYDRLIDKIWDYLELVRVYTKARGRRPDFEDPLIMKKGCTVGEVCDNIHREMRQNFKYAYVWGTSAKHSPQRVGLSHLLEDEDVVQILT